jgi:3,4-dihydroxy 2-butanone 4-phosphate synthase/GTP cyclohydrolase II
LATLDLRSTISTAKSPNGTAKSPNASSPFGTVADAIGELSRGRPVIVFSSGLRKKGDTRVSGDLVIAAELANAHAIDLLTMEAGGFTYLALPAPVCDALELRPSSRRPLNSRSRPEMISIEARQGAASGDFAADRAATIAHAIDPATRAEDLVQPGHVFPLREAPGGLRERQGRTEAAVELTRLAGLIPAAVLSEVLDESGELADIAGLFDLAQRLDIWIVEVGQLVRHLSRRSGGSRTGHRINGSRRRSDAVSSYTKNHDEERCRFGRIEE